MAISAHDREHDDWDDAYRADSLVLLDDGEAVLVMECAGCHLSLTVCRCSADKEPDRVRAQRPAPARHEPRRRQ